MENKKFRTGMFGFHKADVCEYIQGMNNEFTRRMQQKDAECQKLHKELQDSRRQIAVLQAERDQVAGALIHAEAKANEIVTATEQEAEDKRRILEQDYKTEQEKLRAVRAEIAAVRQTALDAIRRFEEKMSELERDAVKKEEAISPSAEQPKTETATIPTPPPIPAPPKAQEAEAPSGEQKPKINIIKLS